MAHTLIERYLAFERIMIEADDRGDEPFGDSLRDLMDSIWYQLSDEDRGFLNSRGLISVATLNSVTVPISSDIFSEPNPPVESYTERREEWVVKDWRMEAA
jgi:hypothetical protein